jgi:methionyl-tRNA formyltransferase
MKACSVTAEEWTSTMTSTGYSVKPARPTEDFRVVMCGCHEAGAHIVQGLLAAGSRFDYFVTLSAEQAKKYSVSGYFDFVPMAREYGIPVYVPEEYSLRSKADLDFFQAHRFDLLVQGGWQRLFPVDVLRTLGIGAIGVHGSADLLPKGRGRSPLNWSLIEGRRRFIMHLFLMTAGVDDGPVLDFEDFDITPFDDIRTLYMKNAIVTKRMLLRTIPRLARGEMSFKPQSGKPSYYEKRGPDDAQIDWEEHDVWSIYNLIRAVTRPYPGATATIEGRRYRIWKSRVLDTRITFPDAGYGVVVETFGKDLIINCRGGLLLLEDYEEIPGRPT